MAMLLSLLNDFYALSNICLHFFLCRDTFVKEMNKESKNDRNDRGLLFA